MIIAPLRPPRSEIDLASAVATSPAELATLEWKIEIHVVYQSTSAVVFPQPHEHEHDHNRHYHTRQ
jgi:hypothetical protein